MLRARARGKKGLWSSISATATLAQRRMNGPHGFPQHVPQIGWGMRNRSCLGSSPPCQVLVKHLSTGLNIEELAAYHELRQDNRVQVTMLGGGSSQSSCHLCLLVVSDLHNRYQHVIMSLPRLNGYLCRPITVWGRAVSLIIASKALMME